MIKITDVQKTYANGFEALKNINLEIKKGEIFALLGPNGAGKTTLISTICGLVQPTSGNISVGGFDIQSEFRDARKLIGLVPQEIMIDIFSNPLAEMGYACGYAGKKPNNELFEKILRDLSLWDKRHAQLQALSGGMKRRFLIARALATEPAVLFLDEPTAGVDVELRRETMEIVKKLRDNGTTIILTTHYIEEAEELADRVGIISGGEIKLVEDKETLMQRMGQKTLTIYLVKNISKLPDAVSREGVSLSDDGGSITYVYKAGGNLGITSLLSDMKTSGVEISDITSDQPNLEEIFVELVNKKK